MTDLAVLARVVTDPESPTERLTCHPRLPLAVATASEGRTVRILDCSGGALRELAALDVEPGATPWGEPGPPPVAWHPHEPLLLVADGESLLRWTPDAPSGPARVPAGTAYESLAFAPDGRRLWASPSVDGYEASDVLDADGRPASRGRSWDTGVGVHPSGALVATLVSDQGATFCLFARPDGGMRVRRQALVLDCDGYGAPLFSADGRHLAVRGNAYVESLDVFAFPSLRRVLHTTLQDPEDGGEWSRHNLAFGTAPGVLWIGTPAGTLLELDVEAGEFVEHELELDAPLTALAATADGGLLLALDNGAHALLSVHPGTVPTDSAPTGAAPTGAAPTGAGSPAEDVAAFLAATAEIPEDGELEAHLAFTDGARTWTEDDLAEVTEAAPDDPTWLQIQASVNRFRGAQQAN